MFAPFAKEVVLFEQINHLGHPELDRAMVFLSDAQTWWAVGAVLTLFFLARRKKNELLRWVFCLAALGICDFLTSHLLKEPIGRLRPCHSEPNVRLVTGACGGRNGFPSNHAANGAAIAVAATMTFGKWSAVPAFLLAGAVGFSRIYLGVHYPSDVIAGWLWGAMVSYFFLLFSKRRILLLKERS